MPQLEFDRFYKYDDLTSILEAMVTDHPNLIRIDSIGKSHEGRDIWLATVTNFSTGDDLSKPAIWIEGNIHATEFTASAAALHLLDVLLRKYGNDEKVTRALDSRVFYVVPRLNPDGAELAMADRPKFIRSSVRPYPRQDQQDGLIPEDLDGDGRILSMRIADPNGAWKKAPQDERLLVARDPDEADGEFYRLLPEGQIQNYDGYIIKAAPDLHGLDLNRNWPADWETESVQKGAGPYPTSEPEIRATVQAIVDRPNITAYITYHTMSAVHLRPYSAHDDDHFPTRDLRVFKKIGEHATRLTGYPAISIYHDFKYEPKEVVHGGSDDWIYEHLGIYAWTTEFWSPMKQAGIKDFKFIEWFREHPVEDDLALLKWSDEVLGGKGYIDWYPFDHPQLGQVELGGWDEMYCWRNPPPEFLEKEIKSHADFALFHLLISPKLEVHTLDMKQVQTGVFAVTLVLHNTGWLPTNVTEKANERKAVRPLEVELELPEGAEMVIGDRRTEAGQLEGRDQKTTAIGYEVDPTTDRVKLEWVVSAPKGGTLKIEARHQRAGTIVRELSLS